MNCADKPYLISSLQNIYQEKWGRLLEEQKRLLADLHGESKNTAGDKHETARAQVQIELEQLQHSIDTTQRMLGILNHLTHEPKVRVELGALVQLQNNCYFLSIPHGALEINNTTIFCLPPTAPFAQAMLGKSAGDKVAWMEQEWVIQNVD